MKKIELLKMNLNVSLKVKLLVFGLALVCFLLGSTQFAKAEKVALTKNSIALHSVVIGSKASKRTHEAASDLAKYLGHITGGDFLVTIGDGTEGIVVGSVEDFPQLKLANLFDPKVLTRRDEYLLRTHNKGIYLLGATDLAAQHAVWGFLYQLGYRQFFPTDSWEIIPEKPNLSVEIDTFEKPDYYLRIAPSYAPTYTDRELWQRWHDRNRITSSFELKTGHSYGSIIRRNKNVFNEHPEYLALVNGVRGGGGAQAQKFCISNEGLRQLVIEDAKYRIDKNPEAISITMDPSDGGDWCECVPCAEMGSISDRVVILANEVAEAINNMGHGEKYVGIYAYNQHSPAPNIDVHPKVIVSIATHFIKEGYTVEELIEGWSKRTKTIGIRDYHDVSKWSYGLPRKAKGGNINYLVENIPYFYNQGARFMISEAGDTWIPNGLGYYLSALLLWNIDAVNRVDEIIEDFVIKSFGKAYEPMRKFYSMINEDHVTPRSNTDLLAHMYGYIKEARGLTNDPKVHARLDDLTLYSRYAELWLNFENSEGKAARFKAAQELFRHTYRMQNTMLVHIYPIYLYLRRIGIDVPSEANPRMLDGQMIRLTVGRKLEDLEPWQSSKLFTEDEIALFIKDGVATYKKDNMGFKPVSYSEDLVPASKLLNLPKVTTGDFGRNNATRGRQKRFTWFNSDSKQLNLQVTGGRLSNVRGNVKVELFSPLEVTLEPVYINENVLPNKETYNLTLKSAYDGIHELAWDDGNDMTVVGWTEGTPMTIRSSMNDPFSLSGNRLLYFYVPKGTEIVGGFTSEKNNDRTRVHDGDGNQVFVMSEVEGGNGFFSIPVPKGQDGRLWSFQRGYGTQTLMTVPPYLARNEKELLLPKEVVEADKMK